MESFLDEGECTNLECPGLKLGLLWWYMVIFGVGDLLFGFVLLLAFDLEWLLVFGERRLYFFSEGVRVK